MRGIVLAGGYGTRLYPMTQFTNKHLLNVYDKPMIFYPISVLMIAGIKEILIITSSTYLNSYRQLLGDGSRYGCKFYYKTQDTPSGIPQALIIGEKFINNEDFCLILGDNFFYGNDLTDLLTKINFEDKKSIIFSYFVNEPEEFGVLKIKKNKFIDIIEKPKKFVSNYVVPGIYFYKPDAVKIAKNLKKSRRGEYEINDINRYYLKKNKLKIIEVGRGVIWFDVGSSFSNLNEVSNLIKAIQNRSGKNIACLEEIAFLKKYINKVQIKNIIKKIPNCNYKNYLNSLLIK